MVRSLTPQELIDAYQVREALEVMAVRLAVPRTTESDLTRLDELVNSMAEFARQDRVAEFFAANVAFHELLCQLSGNTKLQEVHHRLEGEISRFQARTLALRGSLESSVSEHRAILAAVRLGDMDEACELTAAHIRVPAQRLQESLDKGAQPTGPESQPAVVTSSGPRDLLEARSLVSFPLDDSGEQDDLGGSTGVEDVVGGRGVAQRQAVRDHLLGRQLAREDHLHQPFPVVQRVADAEPEAR